MKVLLAIVMMGAAVQAQAKEMNSTTYCTVNGQPGAWVQIQWGNFLPGKDEPWWSKKKSQEAEVTGVLGNHEIPAESVVFVSYATSTRCGTEFVSEAELASGVGITFENKAEGCGWLGKASASLSLPGEEKQVLGLDCKSGEQP